ncbi:MAG: arylsulfatase [Clostridium sp.]|uniref:arylsulfatase n=2 Tax=Clostridium sp. TaxID=1506 RepID=UPI002FC6A969
MKPNIILMMVDQMRNDCISVNGNDNIETPNLNMLSKFGYNFKKAYTAVPSCIASRAAVITGMKQKNHGRVGYEDGIEWNYKNTIASEFTKGGYQTQCIGKMHVYPERNLCGFNNVILHDGYLDFSRKRNKSSRSQFENVDDYLKWFKDKKGINFDLTDIGIDKNSWDARPWNLEEYLHPTNWVVSESIDFLRRRDPSKPFFLKMSFVRPHSPLDPPEFYYNQYINEDLGEPKVGAWCSESPWNEDENEGLGFNIMCTKGKISKKSNKKAKAAYYGSISHIDHQIRRFISALDEYDDLYNTIILFVSDHGDMLGDHNFYRKALPYEGSIKVPFIIYDPGNILNVQCGQEFDEVVELRDIMPTLLDIASIEIPETVDGRSLKPLIKGENIKWREYIHGEHDFGKYSNHYVTNGKEKYIWYFELQKEQFFDLEKDKDELNDLIDSSEYKERIDYFRNILILELNGREEGYSDGKTLINGRKSKSTLNIVL